MNMRAIKTLLLATFLVGCDSSFEAPGFGGTFFTDMYGKNEVPPTDSELKGGFVYLGKSGNYYISIEGTELVTDVHLHCGVEGVNGPIIVDFNWSGGKIFKYGDIANLVVKKCDGKYLEKAMRAGMVYVDVHTTKHPFPGAARGQVEEAL